MKDYNYHFGEEAAKDLAKNLARKVMSIIHKSDHLNEKTKSRYQRMLIKRITDPIFLDKLARQVKKKSSPVALEESAQIRTFQLKYIAQRIRDYLGYADAFAILEKAKNKDRRFSEILLLDPSYSYFIARLLQVENSGLLSYCSGVYVQACDNVLHVRGYLVVSQNERILARGELQKKVSSCVLQVSGTSQVHEKPFFLNQNKFDRIEVVSNPMVYYLTPKNTAQTPGIAQLNGQFSESLVFEIANQFLQRFDNDLNLASNF